MWMKRGRLPNCERKVQHSFSLMYPTGISAPGSVVLRISTATYGIILLENCPDRSIVSLILVGVCACALLVGFLTRAVALVGLLFAALLWRPIGEQLAEAHILGGLTALALVFIGAGAWSIDAYLFGRRVITLDD